MVILVILSIVFVWFALGFLAFLIEAKMENYKHFDKEARGEFKVCLGFGLFSLLVIVSEVFYDWFCNTFMEGLLFSVNTAKKSKKNKKSEE